MDRVPEKGPLSEDHAERPWLGLNAYAAREPADVEHGDIAGSWGGRIDDPAGTGAYAVGRDQEISLGFGTVLEPCHDAVWHGLGIHEPPAVLDTGSAPNRLVAQRPVQVGPFEGLAHGAVRERSAVGDAAEVLADAVLDLHTRRGEALGEHEVVGVNGAQGIEAVAGEGQEGTGLVRTARIRFVDHGVDTGTL